MLCCSFMSKHNPARENSDNKHSPGHGSGATLHVSRIVLADGSSRRQ